MQSQNTQQGLQKRKACDLCHIKKIRCDAKKPECSHCAVYNAKCLYTPHIKRRRKDAKEGKGETVGIEPRLNPVEVDIPKPPTSVQDLGRLSVGWPTLEHETNTLSLPPLVHILPIIEDYFANFNRVIPLFSQNRFTQMLREWALHPERCDAATWATINIVLALSLRHRATTKSLPEPHGLGRCIGDAQSIINSLVSRVQDLKGLQVLLGLAMLFQGTSDSRPSSVLVATAVQLAHRLRLHSKQAEKRFDLDSALERNRVFWIAYVLDKDINMKAQEPYVQQDNDMDVDLPKVLVENDIASGAADDQWPSWNNFLLARACLARIQGSIYDRQLSIQAESLDEFERCINTVRLNGMLIEWKQSIPQQFYPENLPGSLPPFPVRWFVLLWYTYFHSLFMAHRVFSHDADWIKQLIQYSVQYTVGYEMTPQSEPQSPLPASWPEIVEASRKCMELFRLVDQDDSALVWATVCTYISAMIIIVSNNITFPEHELHDQFDSDQILINESLHLLNTMANDTGSERLCTFYAACSELNSRAAVAVSRFRLRNALRLDMSRRHDATAVAGMESTAVPGTNSALDLMEAFLHSDSKPLTIQFSGLGDILFSSVVP